MRWGAGKIFVVALAVVLAGCLPKVTTSKVVGVNYPMGEPVRAKIGTPMILSKDITYITTKKWVGLLYSKDGWQTTKEPSEDSWAVELIYTGRSGDTISVTYREYIKEMARPAFFQNLTYDMSKSGIIVFKDYRIRVLEATNEWIKYIVLAGDGNTVPDTYKEPKKEEPKPAPAPAPASSPASEPIPNPPPVPGSTTP